MREYIPEGYDEHLLTLEALVRMRVKENNLCLGTLMGDPPIHPRRPSSDEPPQPGAAGAAPPEERRDTFQYSAKIPAKKLRCLNL